MLTLATGTWGNKPRTKRAFSFGFTLIEIMIVVFIIGLISAAAVITFGGESRDTELDREAERLDALLDYAREQAELQTRDFGFRTTTTTYQFVVFDPISNEWKVAVDDDALRERKLPEDLDPKLIVEGRPVVLDNKWPKIDDHKPQVMVFANGDITSFEWHLTRRATGDTAVIITDEQTNIRLALPGDEKPRTASERAAVPAR
ncbi:MAG TPA: type II secretion system minor pseudopilin GspH [Steroidobacteraceae bacterium]|nr:type II secretion system minor pseudopilin GspH [Steroidobacteraceae bacterium]